jgi:hypothetical protein
MGSALGDYDGDGDLDWLVTAIFDTPFLGANPGNRLFRNNGNRTFTDVTTATGVRNSGAGNELSWGWGAAFIDYDNDSDQDIAMTNGWIALGYGGDDTTLRRNNGDGTFSDVSLASGITDTGQGRGLLRLDYDADGNLDILIANYGAAPILYRNDGGNDANWLRIKTEGTVSNRDGIGAWIKVIPDDENPGQYQVWEIGSGDSYLTQSEMTAHFGLGSFAGPVDRIEVTWPSGILQQYTDVPINTSLLAREPVPGDFNGDLAVDAADFVVWRKSAGMSGTGLAADGTGAIGHPDGVVDGLDFLYWKENFGRSFGVIGSGSIVAERVPEPAGAGLMLAWIAAHMSCARRRKCAGHHRNGEAA